jgi:tetratricopeptide (TPR) repeat protein
MKHIHAYITMRNTHPIAFVAVLLLGLITVGGCEPETKIPLTSSESQALVDEEWFNGADRPPTPRTLLAMSRVVVSQGREAEAQSVLYNVTRKHPHYPDAYVELAEIHMRNRRVDPAIKTLSGGLVWLPKDHVIINNLGMCYLIRRDYKRAEERFSTAAAIAPNNTRYRSNIALVLGLQGRYEESLALYKQVTDDIEAHFNLAVICEARNDPLQAIEERKQVELYKARAAERAAGLQSSKTIEKKRK